MKKEVILRNEVNNDVNYNINSYFEEDNSKEFMETRRSIYSTYSIKDDYKSYLENNNLEVTSEDIALYLKGKNNYIDSISRLKQLKRLY
jgi:hypothetical protein